MARTDKSAAIAELKGDFEKSSAVLLTEYRGLTVAQLQTLRRALGANAEYKVAKNTLAAIGAKQAGVEGLDDLLAGPTALAFVTGEVSEVAKALRDFAKDNPALVIKGGVMEGTVLDASGVAKLADLESREALRQGCWCAQGCHVSGGIRYQCASLQGCPHRRRPAREAGRSSCLEFRHCTITEKHLLA